MATGGYLHINELPDAPAPLTEVDLTHLVQEQEYDAVLKKAYISTAWGKPVVWGYIYGDRKRRFEDGTFIHTSVVLTCNSDGVYTTMNSKYKVELDQELLLANLLADAGIRQVA